MVFPELVAQMDRAVLGMGGTVRYTRDLGEALDVTGIFDAAYLRVAAGEAGVESASPAVFILLADLGFDPDEDEDPTITVAGIDYGVRERKRDGQGGIVFLLHRKE